MSYYLYATFKLFLNVHKQKIMWYEENDQFVRAPTPQGYESLVSELQERDSVVFESISLPKPSKSALESKVSLISATKDDESPRLAFNEAAYGGCVPIPESEAKISFSYSPTRRQNNSIDSFVIDDADADLVSDLQRRIEALERENIEYEKELNEKDNRICELEEELRVSSRANESLEKYKALYESTLNELTALKEALNNEGKIKKVKLCSAKRIRRPVPK